MIKSKAWSNQASTLVSPATSWLYIHNMIKSKARSNQANTLVSPATSWLYMHNINSDLTIIVMLKNDL